VRTPPPHLTDVSPELASYPELDELLQACLSKQRENRPASAKELDALLAKIEPTLSRPLGATPGTSKVKVFSTSTFFDALPSDSVESGETLLPGAGSSQANTFVEFHKDATPVPQIAPPSESLSALPARSHRGWVLAIVGLLVLAVIGVTIGVVLSRKSRSSRTTPPADAPALVAVTPDAPGIGPLDAAVEPADVAVAVVDATIPDAPTAVDAAQSPPHRPPHHPTLAANNPARERLAEAEAAHLARKPIVQLGAAQLALEADRTHHLRPAEKLRARFLYGDALLQTSGNFEKGCAYLRALRHQLATARAKAAGCPTD